MSGLQDLFLKKVVKLGLYSSESNLKAHLNFFFSNNQLKNKKILDVGGGVGLLTFWAVVNGADAICLEPESEGSTEGVQVRFNELANTLCVSDHQAKQITVTFQNYEADDKFDLIVLANTINHLNESATIKLSKSNSAFQEYVDYFKKMNSMLKENGRVIITDCDRHNFFNKMGVRSPFMPSIEWEKHQSPRIWKKVFQAAGFNGFNLSWSSPNSLGKSGRLLLGNRIMSFFLLSHFRIEITKQKLV